MLRLRDGSRRELWHAPSDVISTVFSPDGQCVAVGDVDGSLWILDARTSRLVAKRGDTTRIELPRVTFTPDGKGIVAGEKTLQCWDFSSFRDIRSKRHMMKLNMDTPKQLSQMFEFSGDRVRSSLDIRVLSIY
jgi:WD40 repeat protein